MRMRVTWPDRTYHGDDWPPSPFRLLSALVAGLGGEALEDPARKAALRHLGGLEPPIIITCSQQLGESVTTSVPNNDGDKAFVHFVSENPAEARAEFSKRRELRKRSPRFLNGDAAVTYIWQDTAETARHRPALERLARGLTALGQGIDIAWATLAPDDEAQPQGGTGWTPDAGGGHPIDVPTAETPAALAQRYGRWRHSIRSDGTVFHVPEAPRASRHYRCSLDPPGMRSMLFLLRTPDDRPWFRPGVEAMTVAAMTRHAIDVTARRIGFAPERITDLMGHGDHARRVIPIPVPNVGHFQADGHIRRLLLVAPPTLDAEIWERLLYRLIGAELRPPGAEAVAILIPAADDDALRAPLLAPAIEWISATPVVLPGWDSRRGKPRPEKALRRLLAHARIDPSLLESADFYPEPLLPGAIHPGDARLPKHLTQLPKIHLRLRMRDPLPGPIALGAGVGYGYGLMRAA